ncbi:MAG: response regulator [Pseudooceanicola sp.]
MRPTPSRDEDPAVKVMICEDEAIVALDLKLMIEDFGFETVGPFGSVNDALRHVEDARPDIAVLDVRLRDGEVYPLADKLRGMDVRMIFHSGHVDEDEIERMYPNAVCCRKPVSTHDLKAALVDSVTPEV